jgi:hypothetical protein
MAVVKKSAKKETAAPVIDLPQAKVKILEAELHPEPYEVTSAAGATFTIDPNLNCKIEIVDDLDEGDHDGAKFYDSFKLKYDDAEDAWTVRDGTKLGALAKARYGNDFFESDEAFDEDDMVGFVFMAKVEPKTNFSTGKVTGSTLSWETIMRIPNPRRRRARRRRRPRRSSPAPTPRTSRWATRTKRRCAKPSVRPRGESSYVPWVTKEGGAFATASALFVTSNLTGMLHEEHRHHRERNHLLQRLLG